MISVSDCGRGRVYIFIKIVTGVAAAVFTLGMPIALIAGNVWYITNSEWLYSYDWWRNDIAERSGISVDQLNSAADQIKAYFNDDSERLDVNVIFNGVPTALYNEREILHMVDVKALILLVRDAGIWAGIASGVSALLGALMLRSRFILTFSRLVRASAVLTDCNCGRSGHSNDYQLQLGVYTVSPDILRKRPMVAQPFQRLSANNVPRKVFL